MTFEAPGGAQGVAGPKIWANLGAKLTLGGPRGRQEGGGEGFFGQHECQSDPLGAMFVPMAPFGAIFRPHWGPSGSSWSWAPS